MEEQLLFHFVNAIEQMYSKDKHLVSYPAIHGKKEIYHVGERAIVFRIAHYFLNALDNNDLYSEYDLDVEYNRNNDHPKWLELDSRKRTVPDIILHKRTSNDDNILVAEFKGHWCKNLNEIENDMKKLQEFSNPEGTYRFKYGIFIKLGKTFEESHIRIFENRRVTDVALKDWKDK